MKKLLFIMLLLLIPIVTAMPTIISSTPDYYVESRNVNITVQTDIIATCRLDSQDNLYENMRQLMTTQDNYNHLYPLMGLRNGDYRYYIRCTDEEYDVMNTSYEIEFTVEKVIVNETMFQNGSSAAIKRKENKVELSWGMIDNVKYVNSSLRDSQLAMTMFAFRLNYPVKDVLFSISEEVQNPIEKFRLNRTVYRYFDVSGSVKQEALGKMYFTFKVSRRWMSLNDVSMKELGLYYYQDGWHALHPEILDSQDTEYFSYQVMADYLTYYAIAGLDRVPVIEKINATNTTINSTNTTNKTTTTVQTTTTEEEKEAMVLQPFMQEKRFPYDIAVILVLAAVAGSFVYSKYHVKKPDYYDKIKRINALFEATIEQKALEKKKTNDYLREAIEKKLKEKLSDKIDKKEESREMMKKSLEDNFNLIKAPVKQQKVPQQMQQQAKQPDSMRGKLESMSSQLKQMKEPTRLELAEKKLKENLKGSLDKEQESRAMMKNDVSEEQISNNKLIIAPVDQQKVEQQVKSPVDQQQSNHSFMQSLEDMAKHILSIKPKTEEKLQEGSGMMKDITNDILIPPVNQQQITVEDKLQESRAMMNKDVNKGNIPNNKLIIAPVNQQQVQPALNPTIKQFDEELIATIDDMKNKGMELREIKARLSPLGLESKKVESIYGSWQARELEKLREAESKVINAYIEKMQQKGMSREQIDVMLRKKGLA